jgi:hypothetical protein
MQNYERAVDKVAGGVEKAASCLEYIQSGCLWGVLHLVWMALFAWGAFLGYQSWTLARDGATTTGTVIENREVSDSEGTTYKPVVRFEVGDEVYTFEGGNSSSPPAYRVGQTVPVQYDPNNPSNAQINNWYEKWVAPVLLAGSGILMALIVTGIMVFRLITGRSLVLETDD